MSAAKDLARKKKNYTMGDYLPSEDERNAYLYCIRNDIRIAPGRVANKNQWTVDIYTPKGWRKSPNSFGPVEIWEVYYNYCKYYYDKR